MGSIVRVAAVAATFFLSLSVHAESLRCEGNIAAEGDSKISVLYKCCVFQPIVDSVSG